MTNGKLGRNFENEFCEMLAEKGAWVHRMEMSKAGQPADVIAVKNQHAFLIDCKVVSTYKGFALSRIEENQQMSMQLWKSKGNGEGWFALQLQTGEVFMFSLYTLLGFKNTQAYLSNQEIFKYGMPFEKWVNRCLR